MIPPVFRSNKKFVQHIKYPMKTQHFFLLAFFLLAVFSCNNASNQKSDNNKPVVVSRIHEHDSIPLKWLYHKFLSKQSRINLIAYSVHKIDTFADGAIWNNTGRATLKRNDQDSTFKFSFYGKRDDIAKESFYVGNVHYQLFSETKTYRIENNPDTHILGSPGGQMIIFDLLNTDTTSGKILLQNKDDKSFIIKTIKTNMGGSITTKTLTINKTTFLLMQVSKTNSSPDLKNRESETAYISDILIDDQVKYDKFSNLDFLSGYSLESEDRSADILIGKKVPEISLITFDNDTVKIRNQESKIVLLDFWELWCGPCMQSLPKIQTITKAYGSKGLITIGIVTDDIDKAKERVAKEGKGFIQAKGNADLKAIFKVNSVPRYILIDRTGIIRSIYYGYSEEIEKNIKKLISN